jgi:hypothetical protein
MIIVGSFLPDLLVGERHQVYSGVQGAGVVMESIWSKFPVWYHLTFLLTIIPAVLVGAGLPALGNSELNGDHSTPR